MPNPSSSPTPSTLPPSSLVHASDTMDDPAAHAEALVKEALEELEAIGALQHSNRMDVAEVINPAIETDNIYDVTDEDIFEAVMEAKRLRERNVGYDDDDDVHEPYPTRREAIKAALTLQRYLLTFNDPFARELDVMLGSFGQWARRMEKQVMRDTKVTDYFPRK